MIDTPRSIPDIVTEDPLPANWEKDQRRTAIEPPPLPLFLDVPEKRLAEQLQDRHGVLRCTTCTKAVKPGERAHVEYARVVKPSNSYGGVKGGEVVFLEQQDIEGPAGEITESLEGYRERVHKMMSVRASTARPPLVAAVENSLEAFRQQTQEQIAQGKRRQEMAAAEQLAAAAALLGVKPQAPAADLEQPAQQTAAVGDAVDQQIAELERKNQRLRALIEENKRLTDEASRR